MSALDLSIIVVSDHTPQLAARALTSVMTETRQSSYEVIVAQTGPGEGPEGGVVAHPVAPLLLHLPACTSTARAANQAARLAGGKYLLLLHADALVIDRAIDKLLAFAAANPYARIWGGRTLFQNRKLDSKSCWQRMTLWNLFCRTSGLPAIFEGSNLFNAGAYGGWARDTVRKVDIVSDAFILIERDLWNSLKGFDTAFENYGHEADLCLRARTFAAQPMFTPDATILHSGKPHDLLIASSTLDLIASETALVQRHWNSAAAPFGRFLLNVWPLTRAITTTTAATLIPADRARCAARHWRTVWKRRAEWTIAPNPAEIAAVAPSLVET